MFAHFLAVIQMLASMMPLIGQLLNAVEEALPMPGQGSAKLAMVKSMLQQAYSGVNNALVTFDQFWPMAQAAIAGLVAIKNASGVFKSSTPGTANAAASSGAVAVAKAPTTN